MPAPVPPAWLRRLITAGFLLSGLAGLVDEIVWSKALPLLIGGTTLAQTVVLATFMGGLALGNWLFGRRADTSPDPLGLYARLELGVGLVCLVFPELFAAVGDLYVRLAGPLGFGNPLTLPLKLALSASVVLVPTFLMGGTLPVLTRAVVRDLREVTVSVAHLYTVNSLGAVAGVVVGGFVLVPAWGFEGAIRLSATLNLVLAVAFLWASRRFARGAAVVVPTPGPEADTPQVPARTFPRLQQRAVLVAIGVSGGASMLYELVWTRLLSLVLGSSAYSFSIMLLTFVAGITAGAWAVGRTFTEERDPVRWMAWAELGVAASILPLLPIYDRLPYVFQSIASLVPRSEAAFPAYLAVQVVMAVVLMFLPTFFIGMTLPLASRVRVDDVGRVGRRVGSVFSVNTVGTVLGAALTGLVLLPALGLRHALELGLVASALLGAWLLMVTDVPRRAAWAGGALAALALALVVLPAWSPLALHYGLFRYKQYAADSFDDLLAELEPFKVEYARDGADTSVAVLRDTRTDNLYLKVNGKTDAGTGHDMTTQLWLGHLGFFLNPQAKHAMIIGLGSGITARAALTHPDADVDMVEIADTVVEGARLFAPYNGDVLNDPRFRLHLGDAKEYFKLAPDARWDVVVSEPSNPWIAGIGNLFSLEYFAEIKAHLAPGGVLVQWVHLYELDDDLLRVILNTLSAVFPHVEIWQCNTRDVLLAASVVPLTVDLDHVRARLALPAVRDDLNRPAVGQPLHDVEVFLANQVLSDARFKVLFPGEPPFNSDTHPLLEYQAPRAFFVNAGSRLLWRYDERRLPLRSSGLHLAERLRQSRLSSGTIKALVAYLEPRLGQTDRELLRSLAWAWRLLFPDDPFGQQLFARYGKAELADAVLAAPQPTLAWLAAQAHLIRSATSMLYEPNVQAFVTMLQQWASGPDAAAEAEGMPYVIRDFFEAAARAGRYDVLAGWSGPLPSSDVPAPKPRSGEAWPLADHRDHLWGVGAGLAGDPSAQEPLRRLEARHPGLFPTTQLLRALQP
jgi:spermidine synthase